ncbi:hypothetical protein [Campylobacter phage vB_CcoM-IBB_35]|uniref:Bacteriophage T5 Orf172 DNA-binding domain-containing protein n=1 Tax=Campylobacter virus IBB35 TaxID=1006972 RepID=H6SUG2_9CAUD|nr:hypothetical protein FDG52_s4gp52 [Campylobacter phage vB_CcoM-IBB_35]AEI88228.1 hypothetical protein [Campylobacter phage vB_CcoM-IBB_35]
MLGYKNSRSLKMSHSVNFPPIFFEPHSLPKCLLNDDEKHAIKNILEEVNFFNAKYNSELTRFRFWERTNPELGAKFLKDFNFFKSYYHKIRLIDYIKVFILNTETQKSLTRKFKDIDDFVKNARYCDSTIVNNNKLMESNEIKKYINFKPIKASELLFCYYANIKDRPLCKMCDKEVEFQNMQYGYRLFCSPECQITYHNSKKPIKHSNLPHDEIIEIIKSVPPDIRNTTNEKIANIFGNVLEYTKDSDIRDDERLYLYVNKLSGDHIYCECGNKKTFKSQTQGYNKTCSSIYCILLSKGHKPRRPKETYSNTVSGFSYRWPGNVYVLYSYTLGAYKVGITKNLEQRLRDLRRFVPDLDLKICVFVKDAGGVEKFIHKKYKDKNVKFSDKFPGSGEFFDLNKDEIEDIARILIESNFKENV